MFKAVKETDKYGKVQTHFYLTQGDTCVIRSTPYKDGQKLQTKLKNVYLNFQTQNMWNNSKKKWFPKTTSLF